MARATGSMPELARELALLGLLALLWGSSYLFIKVAVASIPPLTLIAARVTIAAGLLVAVTLQRGHRLPKTAAVWGLLFVQSLMNALVSWNLLAWGQQYVDSGLAGVLNSTSPIFVFFITLIWTRHEQSSWLKLSGALLGVFGVALIVGTDALHGFGQHVAAQLAVLLGAALYAGAAIFGKRLMHLPPTVTAAGTMLCASLCLVPLSLAIDGPWQLTPSLDAVIAAIMLATFSTAGALMIYFRLIRTLGSMGVASQAYLRAGVAVLLGVVLLGERLTWIVGCGLLAVIVAVAAINWPAGKGRS